jgi:hypothetical protein
VEVGRLFLVKAVEKGGTTTVRKSDGPSPQNRRRSGTSRLVPGRTELLAKVKVSEKVGGAENGSS